MRRGRIPKSPPPTIVTRSGSNSLGFDNFRSSLSEYKNSREATVGKRHSSPEYAPEDEDNSSNGHNIFKAHLQNKIQEVDDLSELIKSAMQCKIGECPSPSEDRNSTDDGVKRTAGEVKDRGSTLDLLIEQEEERNEKRRAANFTHAEQLRQQIQENGKRKLREKSEKNAFMWQLPTPFSLKRWSTPEHKKAPSFHASILAACESERSAIRRNARAAYDQQLIEQMRENANRRMFESKLHKADVLCDSFDEGSRICHNQVSDWKEDKNMSKPHGAAVSHDEKGGKNNKLALSNAYIETQIEEEKRKQQQVYMQLLKDQIKENADRREKQRRVDMEEESRMELEFQKILNKDQGKEHRNVYSNSMGTGPLDSKRLKQLEYQEALDDQILEKFKGKERQNNACAAQGTSHLRLHKNGSHKLRPQCSLDDTAEFRRPGAECIGALPGMMRGDLPNPVQILKYDAPPVSPLSHSTFEKISGAGSRINNDSRASNNTDAALPAAMSKCTMGKYRAAHFDETQTLDSESVLLPITCSDLASDDEIRL
jgi:hypothetical protein